MKILETYFLILTKALLGFCLLAQNEQMCYHGMSRTGISGDRRGLNREIPRTLSCEPVVTFWKRNVVAGFLFFRQEIKKMQKRYDFLHFRVSPQERKMVETLAAYEGLKTSETLRAIIREAIQRRGLYQPLIITQPPIGEKIPV